MPASVGAGWLALPALWPFDRPPDPPHPPSGSPRKSYRTKLDHSRRGLPPPRPYEPLKRVALQEILYSTSSRWSEEQRNASVLTSGCPILVKVSSPLPRIISKSSGRVTLYLKGQLLEQDIWVQLDSEHQEKAESKHFVGIYIHQLTRSCPTPVNGLSYAHRAPSLKRWLGLVW